MDRDKQLIDIHCHTAGLGAGGSGCFVSPALRGSFRYRFYLRAFGVTEQGLREEGDTMILRRLSETLEQSRSVSAAVVMAMDAVVRDNGEPDEAATEIYIPDEFIATETRRYPNLLFGASVNPCRRDAMRRLDSAVENGAVLLKWLPSIQHIDPADPRLVPFYLRMKELGLPLLSHTGSERSFTRARDELSDPERLRLPLSLGLTVIAAHAGGGGRSMGEANHERFLRLLNDYPNLYADISALTQINRPGHLARVVRRRELHGRLLYGTDMPLINMCITTPFAFPLRLSPWRMFAVSRIANPWDRDVALKESLGLGEEMLGDAGRILRI